LQPKEREIGAAMGPLAGERARPWLSTSPSSGLAVVPYIARATTVAMGSSHTASKDLPAVTHDMT
jgi:hypothetical protein